MKNERGSSEGAALIAVFICLVLAALFYTLIIVVKLLLWALLLVAIAVPVYFFIKQTGASREIEANLTKVLAQVEEQEPIEVVAALSTTSDEMLDSVLADGENWELSLRFIQMTEDGEIKTFVYAGKDRAIVIVELKRSANADPLQLTNLNYTKYSVN